LKEVRGTGGDNGMCEETDAMMHTLSESDKQIARQAFNQAFENSDALGLLFYARLFEVDPALRVLFKTDLQDQSHSIVTMLRLCMEGLDERAELQYALRNLGARHAGYGVKIQDYVTVKAALMWTLRSSIGEGWNEETNAAVLKVLDMFMAEMQLGAAAPE
jgi:hemoglobin-like flavoprotein